EFEGRSPDDHADQFSFCVTLFEMLYGIRPFAGRTYDEVQASVLSGAMTPPPDDSPVPARLRRLVLRGLARAPAARWPSMGHIADALERDPWARRRPLLL